MKTPRWLTLFLCLLITPLTACMKFAGESGPEPVETYYIDAPNGFAMAYPADWSRLRTRPSSISWQPPPGEDEAAGIKVTVTSFSPSDVPGGDDRMLKDFAEGYPGFVATSEEVVELSGGATALRVRGHTPTRAILAFFVTTRQRAFILEFSATPQLFDASLPVFEEMADSFTVLK